MASQRPGPSRRSLAEPSPGLARPASQAASGDGTTMGIEKTRMVMDGDGWMMTLLPPIFEVVQVVLVVQPPDVFSLPHAFF